MRSISTDLSECVPEKQYSYECIKAEVKKCLRHIIPLISVVSFRFID